MIQTLDADQSSTSFKQAAHNVREDIRWWRALHQASKSFELCGWIDGTPVAYESAFLVGATSARDGIPPDAMDEYPDELSPSFEAGYAWSGAYAAATVTKFLDVATPAVVWYLFDAADTIQREGLV